MTKKTAGDAITFTPVQSVTAGDIPVLLHARRLCETRGGDLAFSLGRLRFRRGGPMLVEHLGGLYLEHALCGRVLTCGYGDEFDIMHMFGEDGA